MQCDDGDFFLSLSPWVEKLQNKNAAIIESIGDKVYFGQSLNTAASVSIQFNGLLVSVSIAN